MRLRVNPAELRDDLLEFLRASSCLAVKHGANEIDVHFDSPVLAGHLLKGHTVKADHLRPLVERVRQLLDLFSTSSLIRVPRALNAHADKLANQGIDHAIETPSAQLPN